MDPSAQRNRIVVTGARGLLGRTLMHELTVRDYPASALEADIRDVTAVKAEFGRIGNVSCIIHAAAKTDVAACELDPDAAFAVNGLGTALMVEAARMLGARLIYISTVSVFSGYTGDYRETDTPEPLNAYNRSKVAGEKEVAGYGRGMITRLNLIGIHPDGSRGKNFLEWLVDSFKADKDVRLFSDSFVNPLSNWTAARMLCDLVEKNIEEHVLHLGARDVRSKAEIGKLVAARFPTYEGVITEGSLDDAADGVRRPKQMWLNTEHAAGLLGPMPAIEEELQVIFSRQSR